MTVRRSGGMGSVGGRRKDQDAVRKVVVCLQKSKQLDDGGQRFTQYTTSPSRGGGQLSRGFRTLSFESKFRGVKKSARDFTLFRN